MLRSPADRLQSAVDVPVGVRLVPLLIFLVSCAKGAPVSTSPPSDDYLSEVRAHLLQAQPVFIACRAADVSSAAELMNSVMIVSRAWRPPPGATYQYRIGPHNPPVLQLRVVYATPGGSLEVRADGTGVLHILERREPPTVDDVARLSHAMFGESRRLEDADAAQRRPFALQMFAPDVEGTRFMVVPPGAPPQPPIDWHSHTRGFFGGLVTERRIELVSLAGEIDRYGSRLQHTPPQWEPSDLAADLPGAEPQ